MDLLKYKKKWIVTGAAGFIGSHLVETLLKFNQEVIGIDNFSTGSKNNLTNIKNEIPENQWRNFDFHELDLCDGFSVDLLQDVDYVLHQAALGSVPRSFKNPLATHNSNVNAFLNLLELVREYQSKNLKKIKIVYASSSSIYGDIEMSPKVEDNLGNVMSPYALTKKINELYADIYSSKFNLEMVALRYFNVFGRRQNPNGDYAAVIPKWIHAIKNNLDIYINGDGLTSRDFCYIDNVVQANIRAATVDSINIVKNEKYNVACGNSTTLNQLLDYIVKLSEENGIKFSANIFNLPSRIGDVKHSLASIKKIQTNIGYQPSHSLFDGLKEIIAVK